MSMSNLALPVTLSQFMQRMEKVHSFGASIPNLIKYFVKPNQLLQPKKNYRDRGFITNIGLYLCGSDLEMILIQALLIPIVTKISNWKRY